MLRCLVLQEETEIIEGEVVEIEIDRPEAGSAAKTVSLAYNNSTISRHFQLTTLRLGQ